MKFLATYSLFIHFCFSQTSGFINNTVASGSVWVSRDRAVWRVPPSSNPTIHAHCALNVTLTDLQREGKYQNFSREKQLLLSLLKFNIFPPSFPKSCIPLMKVMHTHVIFKFLQKNILPIDSSQHSTCNVLLSECWCQCNSVQLLQ